MHGATDTVSLRIKNGTEAAAAAAPCLLPLGNPQYALDKLPLLHQQLAEPTMFLHGLPVMVSCRLGQAPQTGTALRSRWAQWTRWGTPGLRSTKLPAEHLPCRLLQCHLDVESLSIGGSLAAYVTQASRLGLQPPGCGVLKRLPGPPLGSQQAAMALQK
jgi:hypothetical protein